MPSELKSFFTAFEGDAQDELAQFNRALALKESGGLPNEECARIHRAVSVGPATVG